MPQIDVEKHFAIVPEWVVFHPSLSANAVRVYAALARYSNGSGKAWPSYKTIGGRCQVSSRTAKRAVQELIEAGAIQKRHRTGDDGAPTSNIYTVMSTDPADRGDTRDTGGDADDTTPSDTDGRGVVTPVAHEREPLNESQDEGLPDKPANDSSVSHQQIVDRLTLVCGLKPPWPKSEMGRIAAAAKELREMGLQSLDVIDAKAKAYRAKWPDVDLTPQALTGNWSLLAADDTPAVDESRYCDCGQRLDQHDDRICGRQEAA